ncbi:MAG: hypothetical protein R3A79_07980 [Nannocystaceae bacterium]
MTTHDPTQATLPAAIDAEIRALVERNPGQGSAAEYRRIWSVLRARAPTAALIFGVGRDSRLWLDANAGGETVFVEHERAWIAETRRQLPQARIVEVRYDTRARWWRLHLLRPRRLWMDDLPAALRATPWGVIFVDSPQGYRGHTPGRMKSIYSAAVMAKRTGRNGHTDVLVHDCDRRIERVCADRFLGAENLAGEVDSLRHYRCGG